MSNKVIDCFCKIMIALLFSVNEFANERTVSICEVIQHSEMYRDRVVIITGKYVHGRHGATITNEACGFRSRYPAFGSGAAADAQYYDSSERLPKEATRFLDQRSIREFDKAMAKVIMGSMSSEPNMAVTVVGVVRVADGYTIHESGVQGYTGTGYGFMGRYPVQVLILKVKSFQMSRTEDH